MSNEQKQAMEVAREAEATVILVELDENQVAALKYLGVSDSRDEMAKSAFASVLRGKVQSEMDRTIKAKYIAESKNKKAVADECEVTIQKLLTIKRGL